MTFVLAAIVISEFGISSAAELPANAALHYWMAFALVPDFSSADSKKIDDATTDNPTYGFAVPVRPELMRFFHGSGDEALARLHRASTLSYCAWGTDLRKDGPTPAPYAEKAHQLARLSLLRARWRFEHGLWNQGVDDVIATMAMARHIGSDKVSSTIHFGVMIESMSIGTAVVYVGRMPAEVREQFAGRLAGLSPFVSMSEVFRHSENGIDWFIECVRQADKAGSLRERIEAMSSPDEAKATLIEAKDATGLVRLAEDARAILKESVPLMESRVDEFQQKYAQSNIGQRLKRNPVAQILIPYPDEEFDEQAVGRVRLAMLKAGIDVLSRGKDALKYHSDPTLQGTFTYAAFEGGFELRSTCSIPTRSPMGQSLDFGLRKNAAKLLHPPR